MQEWVKVCIVYTIQINNNLLCKYLYLYTVIFPQLVFLILKVAVIWKHLSNFDFIYKIFCNILKEE